jgi:hypothetical protein
MPVTCSGRVQRAPWRVSSPISSWNCSDSAGHHVHVRTPVDQVGGEAVIVLADRDQQRGVARCIACLGVGAAFDQEAHRVPVGDAGRCGLQQERRGIEDGALRDHQLGELGPAGQHGEIDGCVAIGAGLVDFGAVLEQRPDHDDAALFRGDVQRIPAVR